MNQLATQNPFEKKQVATQEAGTVVAAQERAAQEVQAAMVIAKKFPRDQARAMDHILQACTRQTLAETAVYAYPRGGQMVTGPSIRLAEALAQQWGNVDFGIVELSQSNGTSSVMAYAWDLETNTRQTKVFQVNHTRWTKRAGNTRLEDPRDIYEQVANQGARRLRACILGIIPGDVVEAAVHQCELTQANAGGVPEEQLGKLVEAFAGMGVTKEMIAKRLGHHLESTIMAEVINLRKVYQSLKDGMAAVSDFFDVPAPSEPASTRDKLKQEAARGREKQDKAQGSDPQDKIPEAPSAAADSGPKSPPAGAPSGPSLVEFAGLVDKAKDSDRLDELEDLVSAMVKDEQPQAAKIVAGARRRLSEK